MPSNKEYSSSKDGEIQAVMERYIDNGASIIKFTVNFKGKTGQMFFKANEGGVSLSFSGDEVELSGKNSRMIAENDLLLSGEKSILSSSNTLLLTSDRSIVMQALKSTLSIISEGIMNLGSNNNVEIRTIKRLTQIAQELAIQAVKIDIKASSVTIGNGIAPVARIGIDRADTTTGQLIPGPGLPSILRTD